jgi:Bifunctional DNA primase/polymerase, N-terminal
MEINDLDSGRKSAPVGDLLGLALQLPHPCAYGARDTKITATAGLECPCSAQRGLLSDMTALQMALADIARGWNPVPIPQRMKGPHDDGWQTRRIEAGSAPRFFNGPLSNIGVQLGEASGGLTDVDLDFNEAIAVAPYMPPKTGAIFGRASKRNSHWLYRTTLATQADTAAVQFKDPTDKSMLIELRIGGGCRGAQTVFPESIHRDACRDSGVLAKARELGLVDAIANDGEAAR